MMAEQMMGLTWRLWRVIRYPVWHHPIFQYGRRTSVTGEKSGNTHRLIRLVPVVAVIIFAIAFPVPALFTFLGLVIAIPALLIVFNGTVLGAIFVGDIAGSLAATLSDSRYALIQSTPRGGLIVSWQLALGIIYRQDWLRRINMVVRWIVRLVIILLVIAGFLLVVGMITTSNEPLQVQQLNVLRDVLTMTVIAIFLWYDHVQSIIISLMMGLLLSCAIQNVTSLPGLVPIFYLTLQVGTYLAGGLTFIILRLLIIALIGSSFVAFLLSLIAGLLAFILMREAILGLLARMLIIAYDATPGDFQQLLGKPA